MTASSTSSERQRGLLAAAVLLQLARRRPCAALELAPAHADRACLASAVMRCCPLEQDKPA